MLGKSSLRRLAKECTVAELSAEWEGKTKCWQLSWTIYNLKELGLLIDQKTCYRENLPASYVDRVCDGSKHTVGRQSNFEPQHGICMIKACPNRKDHVTKDSQDCMKVIDDILDKGRVAYCAQAKRQ